MSGKRIYKTQIIREAMAESDSEDPDAAIDNAAVVDDSKDEKPAKPIAKPKRRFVTIVEPTYKLSEMYCHELILKRCRRVDPSVSCYFIDFCRILSLRFPELNTRINRNRDLIKKALGKLGYKVRDDCVMGLNFKDRIEIHYGGFEEE